MFLPSVKKFSEGSVQLVGGHQSSTFPSDALMKQVFKIFVSMDKLKDYLVKVQAGSFLFFSNLVARDK